MKTPDSLSRAQGPHLHSDLTAVFSCSQIVLVSNSGSLTQHAFYFSCHVFQGEALVMSSKGRTHGLCSPLDLV